MEFGDLQRLSSRLVDRVKSHGFEVFIGTHPYVPRLLQAARRFDLDGFVDVRVDAPLTLGCVARQMLETHIASGNELTVCQNLPPSLAPLVVDRSALSRYDALARTKFGAAYGLTEQPTDDGRYYTAMLQQPGRYKVGFFEAPIRWEGTIDLFAEESSKMMLQSPASLSRLRSAVYHINKDEMTVDDVIDFVLIRNMRTAWDQPTAFDSKFVVADQAGWDKPVPMRRQLKKKRAGSCSATRAIYRASISRSRPSWRWVAGMAGCAACCRSTLARCMARTHRSSGIPRPGIAAVPMRTFA
jgi:spore coat polysaccharide biosynthesis protein SpsF (cytidylyltransferase family)